MLKPMLILMFFLPLMLELVADILSRVYILQHLPRGDEVITRSRCDFEDCIAETGRFSAFAEDVFFPDASASHYVEGEGDAALGSALGV